MSIWSLTYCGKHLSVLSTGWRQLSTGIDMEQNYVTVTLCTVTPSALGWDFSPFPTPFTSLHPSPPAPVHFVIHPQTSPYQFLSISTHPHRCCVRSLPHVQYVVVELRWQLYCAVDQRRNVIVFATRPNNRSAASAVNYTAATWDISRDNSLTIVTPAPELLSSENF